MGAAHDDADRVDRRGTGQARTERRGRAVRTHRAAARQVDERDRVRLSLAHAARESLAALAGEGASRARYGVAREAGARGGQADGATWLVRPARSRRDTAGPKGRGRVWVLSTGLVRAVLHRADARAGGRRHRGAAPERREPVVE